MRTTPNLTRIQRELSAMTMKASIPLRRSVLVGKLRLIQICRLLRQPLESALARALKQWFRRTKNHRGIPGPIRR
jgi:hypothetical protein